MEDREFRHLEEERLKIIADRRRLINSLTNLSDESNKAIYRDQIQPLTTRLCEINRALGK